MLLNIMLVPVTKKLKDLYAFILKILKKFMEKSPEKILKTSIEIIKTLFEFIKECFFIYGY